MIAKRTAEGYEVLATTSQKVAVYSTKADAERALANGDIKEGTVVLTIEKIDVPTGQSGSGSVLVLTQAEYNTRAAITDMTNEDYIPNDALVVITDSDDEYLMSEAK